MRKYLAAILMALFLGHNDILACGIEISYNYYLFDVLDGSFCHDRQIQERCNVFWKEYTGGKVTNYLWGAEEVEEAARKKGDREMLDYVAELNKYLDISQQLGEAWEYPTREQLTERQQTLRQMAAKANAYQGQRLKSQWALLYMRANMVMKQHQSNVNFWKVTASKLPESVYREMMENIYAGALLHTGKRKDAINLFAIQGDLNSIRWLMRKQRNVEGIKSIYAEDPASPSLLFLVQDFVNNAQETLDETDEQNKVNEERLQEIDARMITKNDCDAFIRFAQQVVKEGKTPFPALWQAAIGELQYLYGDHKTAYQTLTEAMSMKGSKKMIDNARCIRMVAAVGARFNDKDFNQWMSGEMNWLYNQSTEVNECNSCKNKYYQVLMRLIHKELAPKYEKSGNIIMSTALYAFLEDYEKKITYPEGMHEDDSWNPNYSSWHGYNDELNKMTGDELVAFAKWCKKKPANEMEQYVKQHIIFDQTYFDDMAGTHYLAEGKFAEAIPLLKKVPLTFMEGQNISFYLTHRDFTKPRWFGRQRFDESVTTEGAHLGKLTENPKLRFCEEMIKLQKQYNKAKGTEREQLALQMARLYYQASCQGDCWYLCRYAHSIYDKAQDNEMDFVEAARKLLRESSRSSDFAVKQESLFALAFIPNDLSSEGNIWNVNWPEVIENRNANDLNALKQFYMQNRTKVDNYVTKCDLLKAFMN